MRRAEQRRPDALQEPGRARAPLCAAEVQPRPADSLLHTEDILSAIDENEERLALVLLGGVNYLSGQVLDMPSYLLPYLLPYSLTSFLPSFLLPCFLTIFLLTYVPTDLLT